MVPRVLNLSAVHACMLQWDHVAKGAWTAGQCTHACQMGSCCQGCLTPALCTHAGQSNYAWANMVCEMLCDCRRRAGLPGLAVSWGAVAGVGYVEEILKARAVLHCPDLQPAARTLPVHASHTVVAVSAWRQQIAKGTCPIARKEKREHRNYPGAAALVGAAWLACCAGVAVSVCAPHRPTSTCAQGKLLGRKFEINPPQPIDECLAVLGRFLCGGAGVGAMMVRAWRLKGFFFSHQGVGRVRVWDLMGSRLGRARCTDLR